MMHRYGINNSLLILLALVSSAVSGTSYGSDSKPGKPNVIIIMTDDQGYGELSFHGNPIVRTPHIDQFAKQSVRLTDFHATPMCTPTRGQLMTGLDAARNGAVNVSSGRALLNSALPTMANYFAEAGYSTGIFGKWHLGDNYPYRPNDRGFQETIWFPSSHINSIPDYWGNDYFDDVYFHNGTLQQFKGYSTDVFFGNAMEWMKKQADAGKPFLTYLPTNTPHQPLMAPAEDIAVIEALMEDSGVALSDKNLKRKLIRYLAMIRNIDTNMGRLASFLVNEKLTGNTIVIFTNDNGSTFAPDYFLAGMKGKKTQLWEGGHRVSFFLRWPDGGLGEGRDVNGLTTVQDLLPTLLDLCGITPGTPPRFDGISLARALRGKSRVPDDRMVVINYSRMPGFLDYPSSASPSIVRREGSAVLWKKWRLLNDARLYDLSKDPMQNNDVIDVYPEVAKKMRQHLYTWWDGVRDVANAPLPVVIGNEAEGTVKLTAVEWRDVFVDMQYQVRNGVHKNSYWNVQAEEAGTYEFELRRWPRETNLALTDTLPADQIRKDEYFLGQGIGLPIASAGIFISTPVDKEDIAPLVCMDRRQVQEKAKFVSFKVDLEPGPLLVHTWFFDQAGNPIAGAYYMYVTRLSDSTQKN